jgi:hypothetical protein
MQAGQPQPRRLLVLRLDLVGNLDRDSVQPRDIRLEACQARVLLMHNLLHRRTEWFGVSCFAQGKCHPQIQSPTCCRCVSSARKRSFLSCPVLFDRKDVDDFAGCINCRPPKAQRISSTGLHAKQILPSRTLRSSLRIRALTASVEISADTACSSYNNIINASVFTPSHKE